MHYSNEELKQIREYASDLVKISDMAALMEVDEDELRKCIAEKNNPARTAYLRGKAETTHLLHKQELELAKVGSPLAIQLTGSYLIDMSNDEDI